MDPVCQSPVDPLGRVLTLRGLDVGNDSDAQAEVFEEIATMDFPFEGIPTVPPRKDRDHMVRANAGPRRLLERE